MRKVLIVFLSALLVVGFGASAFALHGKEAGFEYTPTIVKAKKAMIEIGGELRFRGWFEDVSFDRDKDKEKAWYDGRVQLKVEATVSPNTMAVVEIETGKEKDDIYRWGADQHGGSGATGIYQEGNAKIGDLTLRQAYIAHQGKALGTLAGFKVGHMPIKVGDGLFFNHAKMGDDGIILWISPSKGSELSFTTLKLREKELVNKPSDDADLYVLAVETALNGVKLSGDVSYLYDRGDTDIKLWNIGIRGNAALVGVTLRGDLEIQTGEEKNGDKVDLEGWAVLLGADAKAGPAKVTAEFAYGSGDKGNTADYEGFITSLSSGQKYTWVYDYRVKTAAGATNTGLANTWYVKVGASTQATPEVKVGADLYYLRAVQAVAINGSADKSKDLGVELDGKIEYQIDANLVYFVTGGILFAGDAYDFADKSADNAYSIAHGVVYKF